MKFSEKQTTLIIMARWPAANRCKSRLAKDIGIERAAGIQKRITAHTLSVAKKLKSQGIINSRLAIDGIGPKKVKKLIKELSLDEVSLQGKGSLGLKMIRQILNTQKKQGYIKSAQNKTIFIGTDLPILCELDLLEAIEKLEENDIVLGPALDGGYWLLGLSGYLLDPLARWPFIGINWGTDKVLEETISKAKSEKVRYTLIKEMNDVDTLIDLKPWQM